MIRVNFNYWTTCKNYTDIVDQQHLKDLVLIFDDYENT